VGKVGNDAQAALYSAPVIVGQLKVEQIFKYAVLAHGL
jgi:hypothetical protein